MALTDVAVRSAKPHDKEYCPCPLELGHYVATDDRSERWPGSVILMRIS